MFKINIRFYGRKIERNYYKSMNLARKDSSIKKKENVHIMSF